MLSYEGKIVLAPMVRVGTLPLRMLSLEYGADLVWSPEVVDKSIIGCQRKRNSRLGTIDFIKNDTLIFRTDPKERSKLVFQLGSADAELAVQAAGIVADDVSGFDLNCGCPKHFSVHAGMGAALLSNPPKLISILKSIIKSFPNHSVSAKIRLLPNKEDTFNLINEIVQTGIKALTIHCRTPSERPRDSAHFEWIPEIVDMVNIPVIANGDVFVPEDIEKTLKLTKASSIMIARGAQWNASIFRRNTPSLLDPIHVSREYIRKCIQYDNQFSNSKYCLLQIWLDRPYSNKVLIRKLQSSKCMNDLCNAFGMDYAT